MANWRGGEAWHANNCCTHRHTSLLNSPYFWLRSEYHVVRSKATETNDVAKTAGTHRIDHTIAVSWTATWYAAWILNSYQVTLCEIALAGPSRLGIIPSLARAAAGSVSRFVTSYLNSHTLDGPIQGRYNTSIHSPKTTASRSRGGCNHAGIVGQERRRDRSESRARGAS